LQVAVLDANAVRQAELRHRENAFEATVGGCREDQRFLVTAFDGNGCDGLIAAGL